MILCKVCRPKIDTKLPGAPPRHHDPCWSKNSAHLHSETELHVQTWQHYRLMKSSNMMRIAKRGEHDQGEHIACGGSDYDFQR
jgi:hypothetical protein